MAIERDIEEILGGSPEDLIPTEKPVKVDITKDVYDR